MCIFKLCRSNDTTVNDYIIHSCIIVIGDTTVNDVIVSNSTLAFKVIRSSKHRASSRTISKRH